MNLKKQMQDLKHIHVKEKHQLQEKNELLMNKLSACKFTLYK